MSGSSSSAFSAIVSQPSRSSTSGVPAGAHSVPSRRHRRWTTSCSRASSEPLGHGMLELGRQVGVERRRAPGHDHLALGLDPGEQLVHRHHERVDAVAQQLGRHVVEVDPGLGQRAQVGRGVLGRGRARHLAAGRGRLQRGQRHRVDRVRGDEPVDVHRLGVERVLDPGRGPQRALHGAAGAGQGREARAAEHALERLVGGARVGEAGAPLQVLAAERLEPLVDLRVHAGDEEGGDGVAVERQALGLPALHRGDVRLHHLLVGRDGEQKRDVDVEALVERLLDRGHARVRRRDLDHHVGPVDQAPVQARLLERALRVVGQARRHLERHVAVHAAALVVHGPQHVGGHLHVADREAAVHLAGGQALAGPLGEVVVVVGRAEDGLLEDGRVGGDAAQGLLHHHPLELAGLDHPAAELIEPDARPGRREGGEAFVDGRDAHERLAPLEHRAGPRGHRLAREPEVLVQDLGGRRRAVALHRDHVALVPDPAVPADRARRPRSPPGRGRTAAARCRGSARPARRSGPGTASTRAVPGCRRLRAA